MEVDLCAQAHPAIAPISMDLRSEKTKYRLPIASENTLVFYASRPRSCVSS